MTLREFMAELKSVAKREDALDAPMWIACGYCAGDYEVSVSRPTYVQLGVRTEVRLTVNCRHDEDID